MSTPIKNKYCYGKSLRCPKCKNFCLIAKTSNKYVIKCEKGHERPCSFEELSKIINDVEKNICSRCENKIIFFDDVYFCNECEKKFCRNCSKKHFDEEKHKIEKISEVGKKCREHEEIIKYFCKTCFKHFCEKCKDKHLNHEFLDLIEYRKKITINEVYKLQEKYNKEILKMNEKLKEITKEFQKKSDEVVKKSKENLKLINMVYDTYQNTKNNYFNIKNIDFVNKNNLNENNIINNIDVKQIINKIFDEEKNNDETNNSKNNNISNKTIINNKEINPLDISKISNNQENNINIKFEEKDNISSNDSTIILNGNNKNIIHDSKNENGLKSSTNQNNNNNDNKIPQSPNINYNPRQNKISSEEKLHKNNNGLNNNNQNNIDSNNLNNFGFMSEIKLPKKKSPFIKIANKQPITNMIHIIDNILLLTLNSDYENKIQIYEINYNNEKEEEKFKRTLSINYSPNNKINHIVKWYKEDWTFLFSSKDRICKFKVYYTSKSYDDIFTFYNKPGRKNTPFDFNFNLCYSIDDYLFFTTGETSGLTYWNKSYFHERYYSKHAGYDNIFFTSILKIDIDNILVVGVENGKISWIFSLRLKKNFVVENYKVMLNRKIGYKKSTLKKLDEDHVIIGLFMDSLLIFNYKKKIVVESVKMRDIFHIIVSDIKYINNEIHYYFVEKRKKGEELTLYFEDNIIKKNEKNNDISFVIEKKKEYRLDTKSNIIDFIFVNNNKGISRNKNFYDEKKIILADITGNIYSD